MMLLRLLNPQGIAGIVATLFVGILLVLQKGETGHWKRQSASFERLYHGEQAALAGTTANYRAAAEQARAAEKANVERVASEQLAINERTSNEYETRLAAARSLAQRLRIEAASAAADPGGRASTAMPGLPTASGGIAQGSRQDGLPNEDALIATEQAIRLDELIQWVRRQHSVDLNANDEERPPVAAH